MTSPDVNSSPISAPVSDIQNRIPTFLQLYDHVALHIITRTLVEQEALRQAGRVEGAEHILVWRVPDESDDLVQQDIELGLCRRPLALAHSHIEMLG